MICAAENSNKFQKTRFWKEKSVEDVGTFGATAQATLINMWCYIGWFISCVFACWPESFESQWKMLKFTSWLQFTDNCCRLCWSISNITPLKQIQSHRISKPMCQWDSNGPGFSCVQQGSSRNVHWWLQLKFTQSTRP